MPLLHKPRDPHYGVRKVRKRHIIRRKPVHASILPETMKYIVSKHETMSPGQVVDGAVKLYAKHRESSEASIKERRSIKLEKLSTTVSQETIAYLHFMRGTMTSGELIDAAIRLQIKMANDIQ
jgi:hypothetical protein